MATPRTRRFAPVALGLATLMSVSMLPGVAHADPNTDIAAVSARVDALDNEAAAAGERWNDATLAAQQAQRELDSINGLIKQREQQVAAVRRTVGAIAAATYQSAGLDTSLQLLMADHPDQFLAQAASLDTVARTQGEVMRQAAAAEQQLANDKITAAEKQAALAAAQKTAAQEKATADAKLAEAQSILNSLKEEQRKALAAERARQAAIAAQQAQAAAQQVAAARAAAAARVTRDTSRTGQSGAPAVSVPVSGRAGAAVAAALSKVGRPYVFGAAGPNAFDCSGLTLWAWAQVGVSLPHSAAAQMGSGRRVSRSDLQPGDLVFYYSPVHHVGMYIGGGRIVHAANPREDVTIAGVDSMPFAGAVRLG